MAEVLETLTILSESLGVFTLTTEYSGEVNPNIQYSVLFTVTDGLTALEGVSIIINSVTYLTDVDGQVEIFLVRGNYVANVSLGGYTPQTIVFSVVDQNVIQNITMVAGGSFGDSYDDSYENIGIPFISEYAAVYNSWVTKPSGSQTAQQNSMVVALIAAGIWAKLDLFYVLAGHTNNSGESLVNWKSPGTYNIEFSPITPPIFVDLEGFTGDGIESYLDSTWVPLTDAVNYEVNDASYGLYVRTDVDEVAPDCGVGSFSSQATLSTRQSNLISTNINELNLSTVANTDSRGMYVVTRDGENTNQIYKNKSLLASPNTQSINKPSARIYICKDARIAPPVVESSSKQVSMFFAGASLSQADVDNFTDIFEIYMDSNGKGIIP